MIEKAIATPAGAVGHYAPWQFSSLAGLLEARDTVNVQPVVDLDKPFLSVWPAARQAIADEKADEPLRIAAAAARRLRRGASDAGTGLPKDRDLLLGLLRPQVSVGLQEAAVGAPRQDE